MAKAALVIMAAGMGSRYGGNKQTDGVGPHGEFLMQYSVYDAVRAGFDKVVFIIKPELRELLHRMCGRMAEQMKTPSGKAVEVAYVYQTLDGVRQRCTIPAERSKPFGTCHAVLCAREAVQEPFCVINADDYYGADAYRVMYQALQDLRPQQAAMVGYLLKNTVTEHGTVSRGVCRVENGFLTDIRETLRIRLFPDGHIADVIDAQERALHGDEVVSMNFWGFSPTIFGAIEAYFAAFLKEKANDIKAECLLPDMVGTLLGEKKLFVSVLASRDRWFGMTYREDREIVAAALQRLHDTGVYPEKLQ